MRMRRLQSLLVVTLALFGFCPGRPALASEEAYKDLLRVTTWVLSPKPAAESNPGEPIPVSMGSGVMVDARRGLMITAYHVVEERTEVLVAFPRLDGGGRPVTDPDAYLKDPEHPPVRGRVVARSAEKDLAVVELASVPDQVSALPLAAGSPNPGQKLYAVGNSGIGSGVLWRYIEGSVRAVYDRGMGFPTGQQVHALMIEAQFPSNPGDSGGPLMDGHGELVGLISAADPHENLVQYGVDVSEIRRFLDGAGLLDEPAEARAPALAEPTPVLRPATRPAAGPQPTARVVDVQSRYGIRSAGRPGLELRVRVAIEGSRDLPCAVVAILHDRFHDPIPAVHAAYATPDGRFLAVGAIVTPRYPNAEFPEVVLFLPYDEIEDAAPPEDLRLWFVVDVWSASAGKWIATTRHIEPIDRQ